MTKQTILISGAASGIGRNIAEAFIAEGAQVHICDASAGAIAEFLEANPNATATLADVSNTGDVDKVFVVACGTVELVTVLTSTSM